MHKSAHRIGGLFFESYCSGTSCRILEVGAQDVNGTLRDFWREGFHYIGADIEGGPGVDIVLQPGGSLPFQDREFDAVVSSSAFEHTQFFWSAFTECIRVLKPGGFLYVNAPSNGVYHRYPADCWRFYPDAGLALAEWGRQQGLTVCLIESAIAAQDDDQWNDFFCVFQKSEVPNFSGVHITDRLDQCTNVYRDGSFEIAHYREATEDQLVNRSLKEELLAQHKRYENDLQTITEVETLRALTAGLEKDKDYLRSALADAHATANRLRTHVAAQNSELSQSRAELAALKKKLNSSRWIFARAWEKTIHAPRDISRRVRRSIEKKMASFEGLRSLQDRDYRKIITSRLLLRFERFLPKSTCRRLRRRQEKHEQEFAPRACLGTRQPKWIADWIVNGLVFPDLSELTTYEPKSKFAVVLHLYFPELWSEFREYLSNIDESFDIFVSLVIEKSEHIAEKIHEMYPDAKISVFPNHGRDVYPFIAFLNTGVLSRYDFLLKIHSKKTLHDPEAGRLWRKTHLEGLLGSPERVRGIITSFRADGALGVTGPRQRLISSQDADLRLDHNVSKLQFLEDRVGVPANPSSLVFVAGTMFWARPSVFQAITGKFAAEDFEPEPLPADGAVGHAMERYFGAIALSAGYKVSAVEDLRYCGEGLPASPLRDPSQARSKFVRPVEIPERSRVCLFATYSRSCTLSPHTSAYCRKLREHGLRVVLVAATGQPDLHIADPGEEVCDAFLVRENAGFDFGSWAHILKLEPRLWESAALYFANDSVYGPFRSFRNVMERIETSAAEYIALTKANELEPHLQSYFFAVQNGGLRHPAVRKFWDDVKVLPTKREVIAAYELSMYRRLSAAGVQCQYFFEPERPNGFLNPTLFDWRYLISKGFPFVKVELLRDNPEGIDISGWDTILAEHGYDPEIVRHHLRLVKPDAPALRCSKPTSQIANTALDLLVG